MEIARPFISSSLTPRESSTSSLASDSRLCASLNEATCRRDQEAINEKGEQGATVTQPSRQFASPSVETLALLQVAEKQVRAREPRQNHATLLVVVAGDLRFRLGEERDGPVERHAEKELRGIVTERDSHEAFDVVRLACLLGSRKVVRRGVFEPPRFGESLGKPKPRGKRFNAPLRPVRKPLGEGERVREVIGRLVIGGTLQRPFSCFHPIGQRQIVAPALGIVARDQLRLGGGNIRMRLDDRVGDRVVKVDSLAGQQGLVGGVLDQGVAKEQGLLRRSAHHHELGRQKLTQRVVEDRRLERGDLRQEVAVEFPADDGGDLRDLL